MTTIKNRPVFLLFASLVICFLRCTMFINAQGTNCNVGHACDMCQNGQYKMLEVRSGSVKVCCPNCIEYLDAGYRKVGEESFPYCWCSFPDDIEGGCWKGEECKSCLQGPNSSYVGYINSIPVCCNSCEKSGLSLAPKRCDCLHNGP